jgi:selenocysteine lyase/cysteine desulfurase
MVPLMNHPAYDLEAVREEIPLLRSLVPMNNCSQAPQCDATRRAAEAYLTSWARDGMDWPTWIAEVEAARGEFAALIGAEAEDVAVGTSVSQVTASLATGLDFTGRRFRVVVSGAEFPTVAHVWSAQERFGAEVVGVPAVDGAVPLEGYESAIDEETLVVSAAHAYYQTGGKQDIGAIAELAHAQGALLYVDAYQILGTEPFHAPSCGADFVSSGNLKFLMGIPGIAFLWVRPGLADRLTPAVTGWFGRRDPFAFDTRLDWADGARRLDTGTPPIFEAYVCRAGMAWIRTLGLDAIGSWTATLSHRLMEGGRARGLRVLGPSAADAKAPTTAFLSPDSHAAEAAMRAKGFIASARGPAVRLAPHFYTTLDEVDQALDALAEVMGDTGG